MDRIDRQWLRKKLGWTELQIIRWGQIETDLRLLIGFISRLDQWDKLPGMISDNMFLQSSIRGSE